jgi:hypothetical protein
VRLAGIHVCLRGETGAYGAIQAQDAGNANQGRLRIGAVHLRQWVIVVRKLDQRTELIVVIAALIKSPS